jgi:hypothetical protein
VAAGGDCIHGTAVLAFRGNGTFAFGSVAPGDFGAALFLLVGQLHFRHREFSVRNAKGALFIRLMKKSAFVSTVARGARDSGPLGGPGLC